MEVEGSSSNFVGLDDFSIIIINLNLCCGADKLTQCTQKHTKYTYLILNKTNIQLP